MFSHIRKITALILALIIITFCFSGCAITDKIYSFIFPDTTETPTEPTTESTTETTTQATTAETTTVPTTEPTVITTTEKVTAEYEETEIKLWAKQDVNVREKPTTNSKKLGTARRKL